MEASPPSHVISFLTFPFQPVEDKREMGGLLMIWTARKRTSRQWSSQGIDFKVISIERAAVIVPHAGGERYGKERQHLPTRALVMTLASIILPRPSVGAPSDTAGSPGEQEAENGDPSRTRHIHERSPS